MQAPALLCPFGHTAGRNGIANENDLVSTAATSVNRRNPSPGLGLRLAGPLSVMEHPAGPLRGE